MQVRNHFKQQLFNSIVEQGLEPKNFITKEIEPDEFELRYKKSFLHFTFIIYPENYDSLKYRYTIYSLNRKEIQPLTNWSSTSGALTAFNRWLKEIVKKYVEDEDITDPWSQIHDNYDNYFANSTSEIFTGDEIKKLTEGLSDFEKFAKDNLLLEESKLDLLIQEVRELKEELGNPKVKKRKWLRNFKGFLLQEVWEFIKDDSKRQQAMEYFKTLLESIKHTLLIS